QQPDKARATTTRTSSIARPSDTARVTPIDCSYVNIRAKVARRRSALVSSRFDLAARGATLGRGGLFRRVRLIRGRSRGAGQEAGQAHAVADFAFGGRSASHIGRRGAFGARTARGAGGTGLGLCSLDDRSRVVRTGLGDIFGLGQGAGFVLGRGLAGLEATVAF